MAEAPGEIIDCNATGVDNYSQASQIGGVFIVFAASVVGASIPIIARSSKRLRVDDYIFLLFKCFGIGVILSTALIHMVVPSFEAFHNPCLPEWWRGYEAWALVFVLLGVLFVQAVQTIVLDHFSETGATQQNSPSLPLQSMPNDLDKQEGDEETGAARGKLGGPSSSHAGHDHSAPEIASLANAQAIHSDGCATHHMVQHAHGHRHRKISTYLLEFGVVLHSVIIGIALGVSSGDEFLPLLIALSVHQFFEAFAISTAAMDCGFETLKIPLFLCGLFSVTTPIGQAIGIGLATNYSPNTAGGLLAIGILDGLSAGFLLYDGLVNMLTPSVTHNHQFPKYRPWQKVAIFAALWAGAAAMAIIGYWV